MINGFTRARKRNLSAKAPAKGKALTMDKLNAMGRAELVEAAKAHEVKFKGSFDSIREAIFEAQS